MCLWRRLSGTRQGHGVIDECVFWSFPLLWHECRPSSLEDKARGGKEWRNWLWSGWFLCWLEKQRLCGYFKELLTDIRMGCAESEWWRLRLGKREIGFTHWEGFTHFSKHPSDHETCSTRWLGGEWQTATCWLVTEAIGKVSLVWRWKQRMSWKRLLNNQIESPRILLSIRFYVRVLP